MILSNTQIGNTGGFYAMAFICGLICRNRCYGKLADISIRESILSGRSYFGEILSMDALEREWKASFHDVVAKYGYTATIVQISHGTDVLKLLNGDSFIILPISEDALIPNFSVLYGTPDCYYYHDGRKMLKKNLFPYTLYCLHEKLPSTYDFSLFPFGGGRGLKESLVDFFCRKVKNLGNYELSCFLNIHENLAAVCLLESPVMPVTLKGKCFYIHR